MVIRYIYNTREKGSYTQPHPARIAFKSYSFCAVYEKKYRCISLL